MTRSEWGTAIAHALSAPDFLWHWRHNLDAPGIEENLPAGITMRLGLPTTLE